MLISCGTHCYLLEWLLPGVCTDVVVEGCRSGKGAAAVATFERPVARMGDNMISEFRRLGKGLGAVAALVRPRQQYRKAGVTLMTTRLLSYGMLLKVKL